MWQMYSRVEVDLFATKQTSLCPLWSSELDELGSVSHNALAHEWHFCLPCIQRKNCHVLLVVPHWLSRPWLPLLLSLVTACPLLCQRDLLFQVQGLLWHPCPESLNLWVWPLGCSQRVQNTVLNACAPSTHSMCDNRWKLFFVWCLDMSLDPKSCPIPLVHEFIQSLWDSGQFPVTLKVYAAPISACDELQGGAPLSAHRLVTAFSEVPFSWSTGPFLNGICLWYWRGYVRLHSNRWSPLTSSGFLIKPAFYCP